MGQAQQKRRAVLVVEDDAELRSLTAALFEDKHMDTELAKFGASFQNVWLVERLCEASSQIRRELTPRYREVSSEWMSGLRVTVFRRE